MISEEENKKGFIEKLLVEQKLVTNNQMEMARFNSDLKTDMSISASISSLGFASEIEILEIISKEIGFKKENVLSGLPKVDKKEVINFPHNLAEGVCLSRKQAVFQVLNDKKIVFIATSDPADVIARNRTKEFYKSIGYESEFFVVTKLSLALIQKSIYHNKRHYRDIFLDMIKQNRDSGEGVNKVISLIFEYAALENASDVYFYFNNLEDSVSFIFFRIDRLKKFKIALPHENAKKLAQALKQRSGMEAGKIRGHQDGSIETRILDDRYIINVRVNTITTVAGEQITMRLQMEDRKKLESLGFRKEHVERVRNIILGLKGIVVLSGVTGSGKTTTLYSMMSELDADAYNIITMEDPVEIKMKNVNQVQINEKAGQSFSDTIRAVLRQAPDVILLGEIRDAETALRAVEMALTGHLVLTTIHANSLKGTSERLKDLGIGNVKGFIDQIAVGIHQELALNSSGTGLYLKYDIGFNGLTEIGNQDG